MKTVALIFAGITALLALTSCDGKHAGTKGNTGVADIAFAKEAFEMLARGDAKVDPKIDWKTLQSFGVNAGAEYVTYKLEADQKGFRDAFITQFSSSFIDGGGKLENFSNWRVDESDTLKTVVIADSTNGLLKLTVTDRNDTRSLSGIEMVK
jgi:5-enolpyruvylshikimate-3-phosphate synthase